VRCWQSQLLTSGHLDGQARRNVADPAMRVFGNDMLNRSFRLIRIQIWHLTLRCVAGRMGLAPGVPGCTDLLAAASWRHPSSSIHLKKNR
jgi:hypothetical protein